MAMDISVRDLLRMSVPALRFLAELNGCRGFITEEDVEEVKTLDGAPLAALVTHLADQVECIDDADVQRTLQRLRIHVVAYLAMADVCAKEYAAVSDAYRAFAVSA